jgi:muramoyltetrapeptide carboxypeptidase
MVDALTGRLTEISAAPHANNQFGSCSGKLIGGNLSIVYSLLGTNDALDFTDSILFIEDLAEHLYHIDRMIFALEKAGALSKIKGLIVGGMTDLEDPRGSPKKKPLQESSEGLSPTKERRVPATASCGNP